MHTFSGRRTMLRDDPLAGQDARRGEAEALALAYRAAHCGDDRAALVAAIIDPLADLDAADGRAAATRRAAYHGLVRGRIGTLSATIEPLDQRLWPCSDKGGAERRAFRGKP